MLLQPHTPTKGALRFPPFASKATEQTLGSSVPEWPVFSTRRMRLIHATTSCEEGLEGLSRLITP